MSIFDRFFGRKPGPEAPLPEAPRTTTPPRREAAGAAPLGQSGKRPYDTIAEALQAWDADDVTLAEKLFEQGIDTYKRREPAGVDFALGRYGAFLLDQHRMDDATRILEQAIERKTDLPGIWSDYLGLVADRRDIKAFKRTIERMATSVRCRVEPEFVLAYARRADREGAPEFAEPVARWSAERAGREGDKEGRWSALGDLGRILERMGRPDDAVKLWRDAFSEGSSDPDTANRLSMHLERAKDYEGSAAVIHEALGRGLPANVEESLRKRLVRCEDKMGDKTPRKTQKRAGVAAYSVRRESSLFEPLFQIRLKPAVQDLELVGTTARCLLASKESATLVDIDLGTGAEIRRVEGLPLLWDTWFTPDGRGIGIRRTAAIGHGPTLLRFLGADGRVAAESAVPDATSEIALGPDLWYVGCRNGCLYAFGFDGKQRWVWETPGSKDFDNNVSLRPCPYYVASRQSFAAVASMDNLYAVSPNGQTLWHTALPNEKQTRWEFTAPLAGGQGSQESFRALGLPPDAPRNDVKSALPPTRACDSSGPQSCRRRRCSEVSLDPRRLRTNPRRSRHQREPSRNCREHGIPGRWSHRQLPHRKRRWCRRRFVAGPALCL